MLEALVGRLVLSGVTACAAVAAPTLIAAPGAVEAALAPLPLQALRLPPVTVAGLHTLGFTRIGDILGQPRAPLTRRFGPGLWRRIDQALGTAAEPIEPVRPEGLVEVRRVFAEPITAAETIARYIGKLVAALCAQMEERGLGARRLDLLCHRIDNDLQTVRIGLARPVRDAKPLTRLLCARIETIDPGYGIEIMVLAATLAEPLEARQAAGLLEEPAPDLAGLIDTLVNRVGAGAVYRVTPVPSDVPERSVLRIAALAEETGVGWPDHWPRPARLLPRPEPIETIALLPDHPPAWFAWKGVRRRVRRAGGPVPVLFRSGAHVGRPFARRPRVISSRGLSVCGAGCRSR